MKKKIKYNCIARDKATIKYIKWIFKICTQVSGTLDLGFQNIWVDDWRQGMEVSQWRPSRILLAFGVKCEIGKYSFKESQKLFPYVLLSFKPFIKLGWSLKVTAAVFSWGKEPMTELSLVLGFKRKQNRLNRFDGSLWEAEGDWAFHFFLSTIDIFFPFHFKLLRRKQYGGGRLSQLILPPLNSAGLWLEIPGEPGWLRPCQPMRGSRSWESVPGSVYLILLEEKI